jgi:hypothetical protein
MCRPFAKPSSGLEPETPSLPWNVSGNRWQPTATVLAYLSRFRGGPICDRLPPVATALLHKRSIPLRGLRVGSVRINSLRRLGDDPRDHVGAPLSHLLGNSFRFDHYQLGAGFEVAAGKIDRVRDVAGAFGWNLALRKPKRCSLPDR